MNRNFLKFIAYCLMLMAFSAGIVAVNAQSKKDLKKAKEKAEKSAKEAKQSFEQKDYKSAIDKYNQAILSAPNNPAAPAWHFQKGTAHYELKEFDKSLNELDAALSGGFTPLVEFYKMRWVLNYERKNFDAALEDAQKAAQLAPNDASFSLAIGQIYLAKNSYSEALAAFQKAIQLDLNNADTYYYAGLAAWHLAEVRKQITYASEAVKRNTKFSADAFYLIGDAAQKLKNYTEAIDAYRKTLNIKADFYEAYHNLSDIYRIQNQFGDAAEIAKKGVENFPNDANLYLDLSRYYSLADQSALAIGAAQQAVRLMPDKSVSHAALCRAYYEDKQFQPALEACGSALKYNPNDGEAQVYLGFTNLSLDKIDLANEYFAKAVNGLKEYTQKNPDYTDGFYLLGNAYYYANQTKSAIEAYSKSLQLYPQFTKARFNLGLAYFVNGNVTAAYEQYNALVKQDKDLAAKLKQLLDKKSEKPK